jgi:hypothetical protein
MLTSTLALQQAIFATLTTAPPLLALLGGPRIYDATPQPVIFPYLTFGISMVRDASTSTELADEHTVTLSVWSRARGRKEALTIVSAVRTLLHDQPLMLTDHHLVNLRFEVSDCRRDPDGVTIHASIRFHAMTEPT